MNLSLTVTQAIAWPIDDPCLSRLIDQMEQWEIAYEQRGSHVREADRLGAHLAGACPALRRVLKELSTRAARRTAPGANGE